MSLAHAWAQIVRSPTRRGPPAPAARKCSVPQCPVRRLRPSWRPYLCHSGIVQCRYCAGSMSLKDKIKGRVEAFDLWARPWAAQSQWHGWVYEFLLFGLKQAWACLFGALMLALILGTHLFWPQHAPIARYDFLVIASIAVQVILLATKLERWEEAVVIFIFHVVGTIMEIYKTAHGSWIYPEASILRIGGVPLFSGFMYGCIGSYIARIWRLMDFRFVRYPPRWAPALLALAAYVNFFTHHYVTDVRNILFVLSVLLFAPTAVVF